MNTYSLALHLHTYYFKNGAKTKRERLEAFQYVAEKIGYLVDVKVKNRFGQKKVHYFEYYDSGFKEMLDQIKSVPKSTPEYELKRIEQIIKEHLNKNNLLNIIMSEFLNIMEDLKNTIQGIKP